MSDQSETAAVAAVAAVAPTAAVAAVAPSMTASEVTNLMTLFHGMLLGTEKRILDAMADNSRAATERWTLHDAKLAADTIRVVARFEKTEAALAALGVTLQAHLDREHDEDVRLDARVKPVRTVAGWLWAHWERVILIILAVGVTLTYIGEQFSHVLGLP